MAEDAGTSGLEGEGVPRAGSEGTARAGEPFVEELRRPLPPEEAFRRLAGLPYALFLDSAAWDPLHGRYSYVAASPFAVLRARGCTCEVLHPSSDALLPGGYTISPPSAADPFAALERELSPWRAVRIDSLPPFQGGAAGLFGYGLSRVVETLPPPRRDEFGLSDLVAGLYDWVLAYDHAAERCWILSHGFPAAEGRRRSERAAQRAREVLRMLEGGVPQAPVEPAARAPALAPAELAPAREVPLKPGLLSDFSREEYLSAVSRAVEWIHAGDVFQVNLSQRLLYPARRPPIELYLALRASNPAPFAAYFDAGDFTIASSSPEQFISLHAGEVITRPIKGTRSRGYTAEEDLYRKVDLARSEKDRAENVMIVDLLRNDLSRVCRPHSVTVPRLFQLERHPTVHHLVSEVRGHLREGASALDLLRASFPGGSVTGAPKVRAMEIIAELEPTARGPYCGSIAWIGFHGDMGSSILIRTVTAAQGWLQLPVGGGIVADSRPAAEYQETLDKAAGMVRALV